MAEATKNVEYKLLGDPLIHAILPLLSREDQLMLLQAGRLSFEDDFGFTPQGLWLPETAVTTEVLQHAWQVGYRFVPLRDSQVVSLSGKPFDAWHNVCFVDLGNSAEMAVVLGNSVLSGNISFNPWTTYNADGFLEARQRNEQQRGENALMMMDLERFGHHQEGAEFFLKRVLEYQSDYGFSPLDMQKALADFARGREKTYVRVNENSSWSCEHNLGRWTGNCNCDSFSAADLKNKRAMYYGLTEANEGVNRSLDFLSPGWRDEFVRLLVQYKDDIFTGVNFAPALFDEIKNLGGNEKIFKLILAKIEVLVGLTSCGWFFGGDDRIERSIPANMLQGVRMLLK